jgi:hypothetical protein
MTKNIDCNKNISNEEKELLLLRNAVDKAEKTLGLKIKHSNNIDSIIKIFEKFIKKKRSFVMEELLLIIFYP